MAHRRACGLATVFSENRCRNDFDVRVSRNVQKLSHVDRESENNNQWQ